MSIALVAGLGNPGGAYEETRHNAGFLVVDAFAKTFNAEWRQDLRLKFYYADVVLDDNKLRLVKPQAFMNLSGEVLQNICHYYKVPTSAVAIVYDDINIALGKVKISVGGSSGGHNGVENVMSHCGNDFIRFRIGIGHKEHPEMDLKDHVLGKLTENEKSVLTFQFPQYINDLKYLILNGPLEAMNFINQKNKKLNEHDKNTS